MSAPANKPQGPINDGFFGVQEQRSGTHVDTFLNVRPRGQLYNQENTAFLYLSSTSGEVDTGHLF